MSGRWMKWLWGAAILAAVGCNRNSVNSSNPPTGLMPASEGRSSLLSRAFGESDRFPKPPTEVLPVRESRKPGQGIKPETEVALAETELEAAYMEGRSAVERDQLIDSARLRYQRAMQKDPKNKAAMVGMAKLYAKIGDKERAVFTFNQAIQRDPKDHALAHTMATVLVRFEDYAGATEACKHAMTIDPENRSYIKTLGFCQAQLGQWDAALATLGKVMSPPQTRYFIGRMMIDMNRIDEGKQQIQEAVNLDPQFAMARQVLDDLNAGRVNLMEQPIQQAGYQEQK